MKIRALLTAFLIGLAAPLLVVSPLLVTSGCTTPQKVVAFKTLKSVQNASVTGLELYGAACRRREVDAATQARVKDAYTKYQAVFALAIVAAQMDYAAPASADLTAAVSDLLNLIAVFKH